MSGDERIQRFKELVKQGYSVNKALAEAGLSRRQYGKYYDEIWSDPEMEPYRPKPAVRGRGESVEKVAQRLKEYGLGDEELTPVEKEAMELEEKRKKLLKAAQKIVMMYSTPGAPGASPQEKTEEEKAERPEDPFATFEKALKSFEEARAKLKEMLEKMGFKVEDMYMRRDEVERLLQEERQKAQEEMLDDKRIRAVENIVREAITKLTELFKPAIDAMFAPPPQQLPPIPPPEAQTPTIPREQPKRRPVLVPSPSIPPEEEKKSEEKPSDEEASSRKESSESQESSA